MERYTEEQRVIIVKNLLQIFYKIKYCALICKPHTKRTFQNNFI
jgi:hypothetical protein